MLELVLQSQAATVLFALSSLVRSFVMTLFRLFSAAALLTLASLLLQFATHQQVEGLVGSAELDVGAQRNRVVGLHEGIEELVPDVTIVEVPDCGHFVPWDAPDAVNLAMDEFLAAIADICSERGWVWAHATQPSAQRWLTDELAGQWDARPRMTKGRAAAATGVRVDAKCGRQTAKVYSPDLSQCTIRRALF